MCILLLLSELIPFVKIIREHMIISRLHFLEHDANVVFEALKVLLEFVDLLLHFSQAELVLHLQVLALVYYLLDLVPAL